MGTGSRNSYTDVLDLEHSIVLSPTIPADVIHGGPEILGIFEIPRAVDLTPVRLADLAPDWEALLRRPFELPSLLVAARDFDSPLASSSYALEENNRAALSALAVRHQWSGAGYVSGYLPACFPEDEQLDLEGFASTAMLELPPESENGTFAIPGSLNDVMSLWTFGGRDNNGDNYAELWRGALVRNSETSFYRFERIELPNKPWPEPRADALLLADISDRRLLLLGGRSRQGLLRELWSYDLVSRVWTRVNVEVPDLLGLEGAAGHVVGRSIYFYGGENEYGLSEGLWRLDLRSMRFELLDENPNSRPGPRFGASLTADPVDDVLYLHGGRSANDLWHNDLWSFDLGHHRWTLVAPDCEAGEDCPPPAEGSALVSSNVPGVVTPWRWARRSSTGHAANTSGATSWPKGAGHLKLSCATIGTAGRSLAPGARRL